MCKLIMDPTNLVQKFQQKQLIVFSFPATLWGVFVLLIMLVWMRGPVWITSGGREYGGGKLHGTWCTGKANKRSTVYTRITHSDAQFSTVLEWGNADSLRFVQTSFVGNHFIRYHSGPAVYCICVPLLIYLLGCMLYVLFLCWGKEFVDKTLLIYWPCWFFPNLTRISTAVARVSQRQIKTSGWRWYGNVNVI